MKRAQYTKAQVIAAFEARWKWYRKVNNTTHKDYVMKSIDTSNEIQAWKDYLFIKRGTNWRLALPYDGSYPYTKMLRFDWDRMGVK